MKKEHSIVMVASGKIGCGTLTKDSSFGLDFFNPKYDLIGYHLYVISDEEIKMNQWCFNDSTNVIFQAEESELVIYNKRSHIHKVIATTNPKLRLLRDIKNGTSDTKFPTIHQDIIKAYIDAYTDGKPLEKVMVEYETKQLQKPADVYQENVTFRKINKDGTLAVSLVEEEDDVITIEVNSQETMNFIEMTAIKTVVETTIYTINGMKFKVSYIGEELGLIKK